MGDIAKAQSAGQAGRGSDLHNCISSAVLGHFKCQSWYFMSHCTLTWHHQARLAASESAWLSVGQRMSSAGATQGAACIGIFSLPRCFLICHGSAEPMPFPHACDALSIWSAPFIGSFRGCD